MNIRVYYEDTDAAGVVYHASYLRFFERARTEYFRARGLGVAQLAADGSIFPVIRMEIDFKAPARHDELLQVITKPVSMSRSTITLSQQINRTEDQQLLVSTSVVLACVNGKLKPHRIPEQVRQALSSVIPEQP